MTAPNNLENAEETSSGPSSEAVKTSEIQGFSRRQSKRRGSGLSNEVQPFTTDDIPLDPEDEDKVEVEEGKGAPVKGPKKENLQTEAKPQTNQEEKASPVTSEDKEKKAVQEVQSQNVVDDMPYITIDDRLNREERNRDMEIRFLVDNLKMTATQKGLILLSSIHAKRLDMSREDNLLKMREMSGAMDKFSVATGSTVDALERLRHAFEAGLSSSEIAEIIENPEGKIEEKLKLASLSAATENNSEAKMALKKELQDFESSARAMSLSDIEKQHLILSKLSNGLGKGISESDLNKHKESLIRVSVDIKERMRILEEAGKALSANWQPRGPDASEMTTEDIEKRITSEIEVRRDFRSVPDEMKAEAEKLLMPEVEFDALKNELRARGEDPSRRSNLLDGEKQKKLVSAILSKMPESHTKLIMAEELGLRDTELNLFQKGPAQTATEAKPDGGKEENKTKSSFFRTLGKVGATAIASVVISAAALGIAMHKDNPEQFAKVSSDVSQAYKISGLPSDVSFSLADGTDFSLTESTLRAFNSVSDIASGASLAVKNSVAGLTNSITSGVDGLVSPASAEPLRGQREEKPSEVKGTQTQKTQGSTAKRSVEVEPRKMTGQEVYENFTKSEDAKERGLTEGQSINRGFLVTENPGKAPYVSITKATAHFGEDGQTRGVNHTTEGLQLTQLDIENSCKVLKDYYEATGLKAPEYSSEYEKDNMVFPRGEYPEGYDISYAKCQLMLEQYRPQVAQSVKTGTPTM